MKFSEFGMTDTFGLPYDFDSIMHFGSYDFAKDLRKPVFTKKDGTLVSGKKDHLSKLDALQILNAYCPNWLTRMQEY